MNSHNYIEQYNRTKTLATISKPPHLNPHTQTTTTLPTPPQDPPLPVQNSSTHIIASKHHQYKTRQNSNSQLKLSKISMLSISSLSGQKMHNRRNNATSITRNSNHKNEDKIMGYQWADQTFGQNLSPFTSNIPPKQPQPNTQLKQKKSQLLPNPSYHLPNNPTSDKLSSETKLKLNPKYQKSKNIKTISNLKSPQHQSHKSKNQTISTNKQLMNNIANLGIGLSNHKKKSKLVTLTTTTTSTTNHSRSNKIKSSSKTKNFHDTISISRQYNSRSISKSHNSALNSKYSTNKAPPPLPTHPAITTIPTQHPPTKKSNKKHKSPNQSLSNQNKQSSHYNINSSLFYLKDNNQQLSLSSHESNHLQQIYQKIKNLISQNQTKQTLWTTQKKYYLTKIKQLQLQIYLLTKKTNIQQQNQYHNNKQCLKNTQIHNSLNQGFPQKNSQRFKYTQKIN